MKLSCLKIFYHWFEDAYTPSSVRYFIEVSSAAPPAYTQHHRATVKIYLADG
jgi:hypothetical protein